MKMNVYFGNRAEAGPPRHTEDHKEKVDTAVALLKLYCFVKKTWFFVIQRAASYWK